MSRCIFAVIEDIFLSWAFNCRWARKRNKRDNGKPTINWIFILTENINRQKFNKFNKMKIAKKVTDEWECPFVGIEGSDGTRLILQHPRSQIWIML
jgi:hypothetical protein